MCSDVVSWLRHCATSRKVAGLIPDGVIGIFDWHNPSDLTITLGLTQRLTEISTRNISWGVKVAGARSCADCLEIWQLQPPGTLRACTEIPLLLLTSWIPMFRRNILPQSSGLKYYRIARCQSSVDYSLKNSVHMHLRHSGNYTYQML